MIKASVNQHVSQSDSLNLIIISSPIQFHQSDEMQHLITPMALSANWTIRNQLGNHIEFIISRLGSKPFDFISLTAQCLFIKILSLWSVEVLYVADLATGTRLAFRIISLEILLSFEVQSVFWFIYSNLPVLLCLTSSSSSQNR